MHQDLPVGHHQQETKYYCGAACAQMVLNSLGVGLASQSDLYSDNHAHSITDAGVDWYTAPDGLEWTLNDRQSAKTFGVQPLASVDAISRMIAWTIHHSQVPAAALVFGWQHWVVVRGCTTSFSPASLSDTSYSISSFDINNPFPATSGTGPPPPHSATDGCGSGGPRGIADEHVTYGMWQSTYMTAVPDGHWRGKFVAVCEPDPPANIGPQPTDGGQPPRPDGTRLIDADEAINAVRLGLGDHGLLQRPKWRSGFGRDLAEPMLVERLDLPEDYYYIVPGGAREGTVAAAIVDAQDGQYLQSAVATHADAPIISVDDVWRLQKAFRGGGSGGVREHLRQSPLRGEIATKSPRLVWRPCLESFSPYYPFRVVDSGRGPIFVRHPDGAVFNSLTIDAKGA